MFSITGDYLKNNMQEGILSDAAREKLATGIEYAVHLRTYKYAPRDVELCLFSIHTFAAVTEIIDDQDDLQLVLPQAPSPKKHRLDEAEGQTSAPILKASATTIQNAEPTEPFAPEVQALPTAMETDPTTEASKSDTMEDPIAASKNPKKHCNLKNKKDWIQSPTLTGYRFSYQQQMTKKNQQDNEIFMVNRQSQSTQCPG